MRTRPVLVVAVLAILGGFAGQATAVSRHTVRSGETLFKIASRLGVSVQALAAANDISDPNRIVAGEVLIVPEKGSAATTSTRYVVRKGDTLIGVAARLGVPATRLAEANKIKNPNNLAVGKVLVLPPNTGETRSQMDNTYTVRKGDTLIGIAARLGVPSGELAAANAITNPDFVAVGRVLQVPGGWRCPVGGKPSFVNDFEYVKPGATGRHDGIDLFAPKGTAVVAPVSGTAARYPNPKGGSAIQFSGDDGTRYYFAHLDRYGTTGRVAAGTTIGYVGNSGNAHNTSPHLHFESHPGGGEAENPHGTLVDACR